jgi:hypothetical protein
LLDRIGISPYSRAHNWHSKIAIAKGASRSAHRGVECARISHPL